MLFNGPRPLPKSLVGAYRDGTRKVIATTHDQTTIHVAVRSALELKVPVDELLGMLVDRMDSGGILYDRVYTCATELLETGKLQRGGLSCIAPMSKKRKAAVQTRWRQFLQEHGQAIRNGKRFNSSNPDYRLLLRGAVDDDE